MDIEWISDFLELSSAKSFTLAAKNRNRSQPAFSRRIAGLEHWIGASLIDRSVHPFVLTKEGEHFRKQGQDIINDLLRTRDECRQQQQIDNFICFTTLHTLAFNYFARWMSLIHKDFRMIHSKMYASNLHDCVESLQSGQSMFMLSYSSSMISTVLDPSDFLNCRLTNDKLILVSAVDNNGRALFNLDDKKPINYLGYSSNCLIGKITEKILERCSDKYTFDMIYENSITESIKALAIQGLGIGWVPSICIQKELERGDLVIIGNDSMSVDLDVMLYRSKQKLSNEAESLWSHINSSLN